MPWSRPTPCFSRRATARSSRDIGAGAIDAVIITTSSIRPPQEAGRARVLAVTSLKRAPIFPDVPPELIARMQAVCAEAIKDAKVRGAAGCGGPSWLPTSPRIFTACLDGQRTLLGKLIADGNIRPG